MAFRRRRPAPRRVSLFPSQLSFMKTPAVGPFAPSVVFPGMFALVFAAAMLSGSARGQVAARPAPSPGADAVILPEFSVTATANGAYMASESTSGTRIATPIVNLPYSVQVLTEDFFQDFKLFDLDEQMPFVGGMSPGDPAQGGGGGTRARGFFLPYFRNGFYRRQAPDSNSIARVEVVKGPQSAVYGRVSPGGVVNFISKKPQTQFGGGLSYSVGSHDYQRTEGYVTGPIVKDQLFFRLDGAYYDFERPTDFWFNRTTNLSGGVTYKLSAATSLTFEVEHTTRYMNDYQNFTRWVNLAGVTQAAPLDIPDPAVARRLTEANVSGAYRRTDRSNDSYYVQLEHRFAPDLSLRANTGYSTRGFTRYWASTAGNWDLRSNNWSGNRTMNRQTIDDLQYGSQVDLTKTWSGEPKQRTLFTFDIFEDETKQKTWALSGTPLDNELRALGLATTAQLNAWKKPDPFNPEVSGRLPLPAFKPELWPMTDSSTFNLYRYYYGGLLNHTAEFLQGRLLLTGSLREDWAEFERQQPLSADPDLRKTNDRTRQFTYSVGLNYHFIPRKLVGYMSYGSAFDPSPQADPNTGTILGNKTAKGAEAGFKGALLDDTFSYTLSAYRIDQDHEATANPANPTGVLPNLPAFVPGGSTHGDGLSADVSGRVTKNLTVVGNIAWTFIEISKNAATPALVGTKPLAGQNPPARSAGFAARYSFTSGPLKDVNLGLSYQYFTRYLRIAGTTNAAGVVTATDYYLPGKSEFGAFVSYSYRLAHGARLNFALNVTNVFDEEKITVAAFMPAGREFRFTTGIKF